MSAASDMASWRESVDAHLEHREESVLSPDEEEIARLGRLVTEIASVERERCAIDCLALARGYDALGLVDAAHAARDCAASIRAGAL